MLHTPKWSSTKKTELTLNSVMWKSLVNLGRAVLVEGLQNWLEWVQDNGRKEHNNCKDKLFEVYCWKGEPKAEGSGGGYGSKELFLKTGYPLMYLHAVVNYPLSEEGCSHRRATAERIGLPLLTCITQQVANPPSALNLAFYTKQYNLEINWFGSPQVCLILFNSYSVPLCESTIGS